jgi:putative methionine-R-sulfoxide reductase with GAF domain
VQETQALAARQLAAQRVAVEVESFINAREGELRLLSDVRGLQRLEREEQTSLLAGLLAYQDVYEALVLLDSGGNEQIYLTRLTVSREDLQSRGESAEFEQATATGDTYFSPIRFNEATGEPFMTISIPLYNLRSGTLANVLVADFRFKTVWDLIAGLPTNVGEDIYIIDAQNRVVAHTIPSVVLRETFFEPGEQPAGRQGGLNGDDVILGTTSIELGQQILTVVSEESVTQALALANNTIAITAGLIVVWLLVAVIAGIWMVGQIVRPIEVLAKTAEMVAAGDLSQEVTVTNQGEIGQLEMAFNTMTGQLRELFGRLENRVAERTHALETSTRVSHQLSSILNMESLTFEMVEQIKASFNYYHVQIYLLDQTGHLVFQAATGLVGQQMRIRGHRLRLGEGLVGQAASQNQAALAPDVTQSDAWLANPLLPETKTEIAIPIASQGRVLGVLDVQHNVINSISESEVALLSSIADQLAIAIQNARLFEQIQRQAEREALLNSIGQKIQAANTVDQVLKVTAQELGRALGAEYTSVQLGKSIRPGNGHE